MIHSRGDDLWTSQSAILNEREFSRPSSLKCQSADCIGGEMW